MLTRVRLRLVPPLPAARAVAVVGVPAVAAAVALLGAVRRAGADLTAAELIGDAALGLLDLPAHCLTLPAPPCLSRTRRWPGVRAGGGDGRRGRAEPRRRPGRLGVGERPGRRRATPGLGAAPTPADRARLWRYREEHHRVDLPRRRAGQAGRVGPAAPAGRGLGGAPGGRRPGPDRPVRTPGRGQRARQPARRCPRPGRWRRSTGCCGWSPPPAGRSAPSTGSAGPRRPGCT